MNNNEREELKLIITEGIAIQIYPQAIKEVKKQHSKIKMAHLETQTKIVSLRFQRGDGEWSHCHPLFPPSPCPYPCHLCGDKQLQRLHLTTMHQRVGI